MQEKPSRRATIPFMVLAVIVGIVLGFILSSLLSTNSSWGFASDKYKETLFGPDGGISISDGYEFGGIAELKSLSDADQALFRQASLLASENQSLPALKMLTDLKSRHKDFYLVDGAMALIHLRFMDTSQADSLLAATALQTAQALNPNHPWLHYLAGCFWEKANQRDSALAAYQKAMDLAPQFAYPFIRQGRLQMEKGELGKARASYRTAIGLMAARTEEYVLGKKLAIPATEVPPYDYLATLFYQTGSEDSALMSLQYAQEKGWKSDQMDLVQGWLWEAHGFLSKADSTYRSLIERQPGNTDFSQALMTLGWKPPSHKGTTRASDAEAIFAVSLLDPLARQYRNNAPLWMALGQAYYRRGLFGLATESFDSSLSHDPALPTLREKRDIAYNALLRASSKSTKVSKSSEKVGNGAAAKGTAAVTGTGSEELVVIPGSVALLGTYGVSWGSSPTYVREAYPKKPFQNLPSGNLKDVFILEGLKHEYSLGFKEGKLWGIRVLVSDSAAQTGDVFGRMIRTKMKISGEGKGTGETLCNGYRTFQGVVWETDDTFEFMIQFQGKETQVHLIRLATEALPQGKRLCDMVGFLKDEAWK